MSLVRSWWRRLLHRDNDNTSNQDNTNTCSTCEHPSHRPGGCEELDGGWNPHGYCWCPEKLAPVMRGDSAVVAMEKDLESLGIRTAYGGSKRR